ncbi:hypothetical protein GCM10010298_58280 [Streptomyces microflavus]|nr:hypothetical protein GCM10010298_58280 [Streptomyces microflavus]
MRWGRAGGVGPLRGASPLPAPSRNRGSAPDPFCPQAPDGLRFRGSAPDPAPQTPEGLGERTPQGLEWGVFYSAAMFPGVILGPLRSGIRPESRIKRVAL